MSDRQDARSAANRSFLGPPSEHSTGRLPHRDQAAAHTAPRVEVAWTPELRRWEREYDEAKHEAHAAHDGFEEGLIRAAQEAWKRFSRAVRSER